MNDDPTPDNVDERQLIDGWVQLQHAHRAGKPVHDLLWAHAVLDEICDKDPSVCLRLIGLILDRDSSDVIMGNLAAGPLEDLLSRHGAAIIDTVELEARQRKKFRELLSGVWRNVIADDVWDRVLRLRAIDA
jgi:hypothetical protein